MTRPRWTAKQRAELPATGDLTGRAVQEWIGKTPDTPAPSRVKLRIVLRQHGKCNLTGVKFDLLCKPQFDHIVRLKDGGENRERNLQAIAPSVHKQKSASEAKTGAKERSIRQKHLGIKRPMSRLARPHNDDKYARIAAKERKHKENMAAKGAK